MKTSIVSRLALALLAGSWALPSWATLVPRYFVGDDIDHPSAYYDTVLGITWLTDANYAQTSGYDTDGRMNWTTATAWADSLTLGGATEWRLPDTDPINGSAYNYNLQYNGTTDYGYNMSAPGTTYGGATGSEMAHMFYNTLGNKGYCTITSGYPSPGCTAQSGYGLSNDGDFLNLQSNYYWSGTAYAPSPGNVAWYFDFDFGYQGRTVQSYEFYAWAVHSGDVGAAAPVPIPAAAWLFGSGLVGLLGIGRRRRLALR